MVKTCKITYVNSVRLSYGLCPINLGLNSTTNCGMVFVLERSHHTDANFIGLRDGTVVTARAMVRVVEQHRWSAERVHALTGLPGAMKSSFDGIEAEAEPHNFSQAELPDGEDPHVVSRRRLKITLKDLGRYHFSKNCPKCMMQSKPPRRCTEGPPHRGLQAQDL